MNPATFLVAFSSRMSLAQPKNSRTGRGPALWRRDTLSSLVRPVDLEREAMLRVVALLALILAVAGCGSTTPCDDKDPYAPCHRQAHVPG